VPSRRTACRQPHYLLLPELAVVCDERGGGPAIWLPSSPLSALASSISPSVAASPIGPVIAARSRWYLS
jgi:hypothetical protein